MSDLRDLYRDVVIDHNRNPRNFRELAAADRRVEGYNPLCGDRLVLYLKLGDSRIEDASFQGAGCAISIASASLMTEAVKGRTEEEAQRFMREFQEMVTAPGESSAPERMGKLAALAGVKDYPSRVKCATLSWHTLRAALAGSQEAVSTE